MIVDRIARFIQDPASASFEDLAVEAFAFDFERVEPFRRLCEGRGMTPGTLASWYQIPPVPTAAFKSPPARSSAAAAPPRERRPGASTTTRFRTSTG
jgi:hypothetical protein